MSETGLKRVLGLPGVTFIAVGFMIGGGVFVFTGIVLKITGESLPVAYALAVVPVFITMMPLAMLGSAIPSTGANYKYPSRMVSPGIAFVGVWVYALASFFGQIPLYSLSCARYINVILPGVSTTLLAVGIVTLFYIVNIFGIKIAALVQALLVIILLSALIFYSGTGLARMDLTQVTTITGGITGSILLGSALLTFTYFGANGIIELGGEIINPGKVIPRAFFIAFPIVAVVYVTVALATVGAVPVESIISAKEPLVEVSSRIMSRPGFIFFIMGGAILALTTTLNALFIVGTKSLLIIVEDDILPKYLGKLSARFHTPHILLTLIWVFSIIGIISGFTLETLASYASLGGLIIFAPIMLASMKLQKLYPDRYERSSFKLKGVLYWICPIVGLLMVLFFGLIILYDLKTAVKISSFLIFIASGVLYYYLRKAYLKKRGFDLSDLLHRKDWNE